VNDEKRRTLNGVVVSHFEVLRRHLPEETDKTTKSLSGIVDF
jgi:hypothetical protein